MLLRLARPADTVGRTSVGCRRVNSALYQRFDMGWYNRVLASPCLTARERAVLYLLQNGLRAGEVARLKIPDVHLARSRAYVFGKDGTARVVPLMPWTVAAIDQWLSARRFSVSVWLFPGRRGRSVGRTTIFDVVRHVCRRIFMAPEDQHVVKRVTPYGFRRYFAALATKRGVNIFVLMKVMGIHRHETLLRCAGHG